MNRLLAASAAAYGAIGVGAMARPELVPATFGGTATTPASRTEVRAVYGGMCLAMAGLIAASPAARVPMGVLSAGLAAGRVAGAALEEERPEPVTLAFVAVETALATALFVGARRG